MCRLKSTKPAAGTQRDNRERWLRTISSTTGAPMGTRGVVNARTTGKTVPTWRATASVPSALQHANAARAIHRTEHISIAEVSSRPRIPQISKAWSATEPASCHRRGQRCVLIRLLTPPNPRRRWPLEFGTYFGRSPWSCLVVIKDWGVAAVSGQVCRKQVWAASDWK